MNILVIGGTGTMGAPLVDYLSTTDNNIYVISRHPIKNRGGNVTNWIGDAFNCHFLQSVFCMDYDCVVDFLWYNENSLKSNLSYILPKTKQYIHLSSAAVYVDSKTPINESTPRIIDVIDKTEALYSNEYHIVKARLEDIVRNSEYSNWTIIRPHITFNSNRIPLGTWETNVWMNRVVNKKTIPIPVDILRHRTTFTSGREVAFQISQLIGNKNAIGQIIQLGAERVVTWEHILSLLVKETEQSGYHFKMISSNSESLSCYFPYMKCRFLFDRKLDRIFDTSLYKKISKTSQIKLCVDDKIFSLESEIHRSFKDVMNTFRLQKQQGKLYIDYYTAIVLGKITNEHTPLRQIGGIKGKIKYIIKRIISKNEY